MGATATAQAQAWAPKGSGSTIPGESHRAPARPPSALNSISTPQGHRHRCLIRETGLIISRHCRCRALQLCQVTQPTGDWSGITRRGMVAFIYPGIRCGSFPGFPQVPVHPSPGELAHHPALGLPPGFGAA